ncbi:hypothetical protein LPJ53_003171 [Coemansia erecta]|uniref:DUF4246 domain-containing protein n=1 Tax=Coemansia erecta TaxID=147472 RepID=A0A9W8CT20_9FUNG|nr:hypothetical protein LPJ53_003171 [Coemansia erecta]
MQVKAYTKLEPSPDTPAARLTPLYNAYNVAWKTKWEVTIIEHSARIRSEPGWAQKLDDKSAVQEWLSRLGISDLTQEHVDYLLAELRYYARLQRANAASGAMLSTVDMVWTMGISDSDPLAQDFKHHVVSMLEGDCLSHQDWSHSAGPQSTPRPIADHSPNHRTRHLVSPSLYTLRFNMTRLLDQPATSPAGAFDLCSYSCMPGSHAAWKQAVRELNQRMSGDSSFVPISEEYLDKLDPEERHWLPADIYVNDDGSVAFKSYINNLHPGRFPEAYRFIAGVIARCLPALEQVLTDWAHLRNLRMPYDWETSVCETVPHPKDSHGVVDDPEFDYDDEEDQWYAGLVETMPTPDVFSEPSRPLVPYSLRNKDLQVVVKMDNVYPSVRVVSTSIVPPQQKEWWVDEVKHSPLMRHLPLFAQEEITTNVEMLMPFDQASAIREMLDEKLLVDHNRFNSWSSPYDPTRFNL